MDKHSYIGRSSNIYIYIDEKQILANSVSKCALIYNVLLVGRDTKPMLH